MDLTVGVAALDLPWLDNHLPGLGCLCAVEGRRDPEPTFLAFMPRSAFSLWCRSHWSSCCWSRWHGVDLAPSRSHGASPRRCAGYTAPMVAVAAWLIGGGFSVGVGLLAARFLGQPVGTIGQAIEQEKRRTDLLGNASATFADRAAALNADAPLIVPQPYLWVAAAVVALLLAALAVAFAIVIWVLTFRHKGATRRPDPRRRGLSRRNRKP